jgi:SH3-like domain-containing protein
MPLKKLSQEKNWYQVQDLEGKIHWIRKDLVSTSSRCAVIKNDYAHLRQGPGRSFPLAQAERGLKYLSFEVLEEKNSWVRLRDADGDVVWIHRPLLWMSEDPVPIQP